MDPLVFYEDRNWIRKNNQHLATFQHQEEKTFGPLMRKNANLFGPLGHHVGAHFYSFELPDSSVCCQVRHSKYACFALCLLRFGPFPSAIVKGKNGRVCFV